jgi:hypothetical protein
MPAFVGRSCQQSGATRQVTLRLGPIGRSRRAGPSLTTSLQSVHKDTRLACTLALQQVSGGNAIGGAKPIGSAPFCHDAQRGSPIVDNYAAAAEIGPTVLAVAKFRFVVVDVDFAVPFLKPDLDPEGVRCVAAQ